MPQCNEANYRNYRADISKNSLNTVNPDEIKFIQSALNKILGTSHEGKYYHSPGKCFSSSTGIGVDGIVGKNTIKK